MPLPVQGISWITFKHSSISRPAGRRRLANPESVQMGRVLLHIPSYPRLDPLQLLLPGCYSAHPNVRR